jgi:uncharacterized radical SAM superfamily Fe-S cluster-containing enzyme
MKEVLSRTKSLCPVCLKVVPAARVSDGPDVFLEKTCREHGQFKAILWRGEPGYRQWGIGEDAPGAEIRQTASVNSCPNDCGLCPEHQAQTCTVLMEVTGRCNLRCPVCFACGNDGANNFHPDMAGIRAMLDTIINAGGPYPLQLSGGEPTLRDDLPEIVSLAKKLGFYHVQINTNGLRLAKDRQYLKRLKDAGADNFMPRRRKDSHCGFSGFFVLDENNRLKDTTIFTPANPASAGCSDVSGFRPSRETPSEHVRKFINSKSRFIEPLPTKCSCEPQGTLSSFFERATAHYLSISGMPFQDVWTVDLERLKGCCIHVVTPAKRLIPFCAFYLTNMEGKRLAGKGYDAGGRLMSEAKLVEGRITDQARYDHD